MDRRLRIPLALATCCAVAGPALADPGDACVTAYEQAQQLRRGGKLLRARAELRLCQRACPTMLTGDCDRWLGEVDATIPTVVLSAKDPEGKDVPAVRVLVDGAPLADRIDDKPAEVDPGPHLFRFERGASGVEARATLREGERGHLVGVTFEREEAAPPPSKGPPALVYVLGIGGVAALGVGAVLGIKGQVDKSALVRDCAPFCKKGEVSEIRTEWWIAGISAGVGAVAVGAAAWLWLSSPSEPTRVGLGIDVRPLPGGALGRVTHSF